MINKEDIIFPLRSVFHYIVMFTWLSAGILIGIFNRKNGGKIIISWYKFFLKLYNIRVHVENDNGSIEKLNGCIFTLLSQKSLLDGPIGISVIPGYCRGIVNLEYAMIPFFGWATSIISWVIIRQWPSQARKVLSKVNTFLRNGGNLWMSIEGKRSKDGSLSHFKKGPVVMAIDAQAKIVPVIIYGTDSCLGYGKWRIRSAKIVVRFLKMVQTTGLEYNDRDMIVNQLYDLAMKELSSMN